MIRSVLCLAVAAALFPAAGLAADAEDSARSAEGHPFFVFCHDTHDANKRSLAEQAAMVKSIGFDGLGHRWLKDVPERLKTLDAHGLRLFMVCLRANIDPAKPKFDPRLAQVVKQLEGRDVALAVLVQGGKPSDASLDDRAVAVVREIADLAAASGLRVALYPHTNDWLEKTSDGVRVCRKADRKNVGVMFNLCHWLKADDTTRLDATLNEAMPHLSLVLIHGADPPPGNWDRLIQPLGQGAFDVAGLIRKLDALGYQGPVGLMAYGIGGDAAEHLRQSMDAWKRMKTE